MMRLEGPLQAWGGHDSKFGVRRTEDAPTKSGVMGLVLAALGVGRREATEWLPVLAGLRMGVRVDRPGVRWWDYHTVGAGQAMQIAKGRGKSKDGPMLTRREYLSDASFLVALEGEGGLVGRIVEALRSPHWTPYLGRKSCPPSRPLVEDGVEGCGGVWQALARVPWRRRIAGEAVPGQVEALVDWVATAEEPEAPADAEVWYDVPVSLDPPAHRPRFVVRRMLTVGAEGVAVGAEMTQKLTPGPARPRADYGNSAYRAVRKERLQADRGLCAVCKGPAGTVQHVTYRHAGGEERLEELRSLCRLCHDAVTMLEYGAGMGLDRINPEDREWRSSILAKRDEIVRFRSLETRRRRLAVEDVE